MGQSLETLIAREIARARLTETYGKVYMGNTLPMARIIDISEYSDLHNFYIGFDHTQMSIPSTLLN